MLSRREKKTRLPPCGRPRALVTPRPPSSRVPPPGAAGHRPPTRPPQARTEEKLVKSSGAEGGDTLGTSALLSEEPVTQCCPKGGTVFSPSQSPLVTVWGRGHAERQRVPPAVCGESPRPCPGCGLGCWFRSPSPPAVSRVPLAGTQPEPRTAPPLRARGPHSPWPTLQVRGADLTWT